MDKVSVLIPCYNAERFIKEAVVSVLQQDYPEKEIIVIDDGSTDNSLSILKSFLPEIQLISRDNRGGNYTRNQLLENATGKWIQYLDADDYLAPGKISEQMDWIQKNPGYDIVYGPVMRVYDDGTERKLVKQDVIYPEDGWSAMISWQIPQTGSSLFLRTALTDVKGWNENQKVCQEHELYLRLLKAGKKFIGVRELNNYVHYRLWSDDTVSRRNPEQTYLARMKIMEGAYVFLRDNNMLTDQRREVYQTWCLLVSRGLWTVNRNESIAFFERNKSVYPLTKIRTWLLNPGFQRMVAYLGYSNAENIATLLRKLKGR